MRSLYPTCWPSSPPLRFNSARGCPPAAASGSAPARLTVRSSSPSRPRCGARSSTTPVDATTASRPRIGSPCRTSSSSSRPTASRSRVSSTYFRTAPLRSLDDQLYSSTLPNTNDDGIVCLGSVRVSGATVGERVDALIGAFWASRFNQDLRRHPLPFSGGFRSWASRSRRDPLAALSLAYDPYWRTLRQVAAPMAGVAPNGPARGRSDPRGRTRDRCPDAGTAHDRRR